MTQPRISSEMTEMLRFRIPPWFDPVPWFIWERLDQETLVKLTAVQLQLQKSVLAAQMRAINQALNVLEHGKR